MTSIDGNMHVAALAMLIREGGAQSQGPQHPQPHLYYLASNFWFSVRVGSGNVVYRSFILDGKIQEYGSSEKRSQKGFKVDYGSTEACRWAFGTPSTQLSASEGAPCMSLVHNLDQVGLEF
jgi:hypothetical protein